MRNFLRCIQFIKTLPFSYLNKHSDNFSDFSTLRADPYDFFFGGGDKKFHGVEGMVEKNSIFFVERLDQMEQENVVEVSTSQVVLLGAL